MDLSPVRLIKGVPSRPRFSVCYPNSYPGGTSSIWAAKILIKAFELIGAPEEIRTPDPQFVV